MYIAVGRRDARQTIVNDTECCDSTNVILVLVFHNKYDDLPTVTIAIEMYRFNKQ